MISEWFYSMAVGFVEFLAGVFGEWKAPAGFLQARNSVADMLAGFASVGVWVNWVVMGICVGIALASWGVVLAIKLVRAVVAHIPMFGGSGD